MKGKILVTGAAGFIGFHTVEKLLEEGFEVVGLDNINDYYSPALKYSRLKESGVSEEKIKWYTFTQSTKNANYRFIRMNLEDKQQLFNLFQNERFDYVVNLAAQAGVRYSIENPDVYMQSNVIGFHYILEACRSFPVKHLVHASSSSVYGANAKIPFSEEDQVDTPVSLYASTKKSNELMAHAYSELYDIPVTCLRFFTVYGPWGRPDMAPMLFAKAIFNNQPIDVFNNGEMERDFTFVDDIARGIINTAVSIPLNTPKYRVLNIGNGSPIKLMDFISTIERYMGKESVKNYMPMQAGDVKKTWADQTKFIDSIGYRPSTRLDEGISKFITWFTAYFDKRK